jgi:uncharacterized protein (TIGR01244 family)
MDPVTISGWQRISPEVTTSGRLKERDTQRLAMIGVRSVIDLSPPDHPDSLGNEADHCAQAGIAYINIPVTFDDLREEDYKEFCDALEHARRPVHLHCIANWRVSAFLYRYHLEHGMPEREARKLIREQWLPDATDHPDARPWGEFVTPAKQVNTGQTAPPMLSPGGTQST